MDPVTESKEKQWGQVNDGKKCGVRTATWALDDLRDHSMSTDCEWVVMDNESVAKGEIEHCFDFQEREQAHASFGRRGAKW